ncbi:hypothetical protein [Pseudonocardia sp.]|uniref:hypothetical protein n=1 Tax=Pseudonocardia sp. TaxID=60912 RepID=UPI003D0D11EF
MNDARSLRAAATGRHAFRDPADDAGFATPIFNALVAGGWPPRQQADPSAATTAALRTVMPDTIRRSPGRARAPQPPRAATPTGRRHGTAQDRGRWQPVAIPGSGGRRHLDGPARQSGRHHLQLTPGLAG